MMHNIGIGVSSNATHLTNMEGIPVEDEIKKLEKKIKELKENIKSHKKLQKSFGIWIR